jgi:hypothetical protein
MSEPTKLRTVAALRTDDCIAMLKDLLARAERGDVRGLVVGFYDGDLNCVTCTSPLHYTEKLGLIEATKADIIAQAEGRLCR